MYTHIHAYINRYIHAYIHAHPKTHTRTYAYIHKYIHAHTHTHTHMYISSHATVLRWRASQNGQDWRQDSREKEDISLVETLRAFVLGLSVCVYMYAYIRT
jgi:hypothetical protein